jgi:hypothetical protein
MFNYLSYTRLITGVPKITGASSGSERKGSATYPWSNMCFTIHEMALILAQNIVEI